jgi:metal-sulfur cluster biosynthetic enzyme
MSHDFLEATRPADRQVADAPLDEAIDEVAVWRALYGVIDPEIGLDLVTLGMVYEVECLETTVRVIFTLTTPGCPMQEVIRSGIERAVAAVPGVRQVAAELVWEPRWHPGMIEEGAL